ncbi:hypothetical protein HYPSUDRAFT_69689 [Hypholoma sublateritium FD-334 SS-4]|uniref:Uncharacterized protein n=1 Tax=Hypholoma sublateritium (strain FD-334 SS-4) TaxID=945553 RepID=A0A0D2M6I3_HYPSF|nr:hypothetical protein HYPSUDRAFT_69689 [Hypholoma sublateritium FD-334 SS-4]
MRSPVYLLRYLFADLISRSHAPRPRPHPRFERACTPARPAGNKPARPSDAQRWRRTTLLPGQTPPTQRPCAQPPAWRRDCGRLLLARARTTSSRRPTAPDPAHPPVPPRPRPRIQHTHSPYTTHCPPPCARRTPRGQKHATPRHRPTPAHTATPSTPATSAGALPTRNTAPHRPPCWD